MRRRVEGQAASLALSGNRIFPFFFHSDFVLLPAGKFNETLSKSDRPSAFRGLEWKKEGFRKVLNSDKWNFTKMYKILLMLFFKFKVLITLCMNVSAELCKNCCKKVHTVLFESEFLDRKRIKRIFSMFF